MLLFDQLIKIVRQRRLLLNKYFYSIMKSAAEEQTCLINYLLLFLLNQHLQTFKSTNFAE
jgi:hypothetical protein